MHPNIPLLARVALPVCSLVLLWTLCPLARGETNAGKSKPGPAPTASAPANPDSATLQLSDEPLRIESVGLKMQLPRDATTQATRLGDQTSIQILPDRGAWFMQVRTPKPDEQIRTLAEFTEQLAGALRQSVSRVDPVSGHLVSAVEMIQPVGELKIVGVDAPASRFYAAVPQDDKAPRLIRGLTVLQPAKDQFVVIELTAPEPAFTSARRVYETCVATVRFQDASEAEQQRKAAVSAGIEVLASLDSASLEKLLPAGERWYRMYRPAPSGAPADAQEIGYYSVKFWKGRRSEMGGQGAASAVGDNPEGFLAQVKARFFQPTSEGLRVTDAASTGFLALNRREESWTVKTAVKGPGAPEGLFVETGARTGQSMQVEVRAPAQPARTLSPVVPPEGLASFVENQLLPRLLAQRGKPGTFGFYAYRSDSGGVALRRDRVAPVTGGIEITTTPRGEENPSVGLYDRLGDLQHVQRPGGQIDEPIEPAELTKLLQGKGLPTGAVK